MTAYIYYMQAATVDITRGYSTPDSATHTTGQPGDWNMCRECLHTQKHFLWTIDGPDSSYSCFEIHICWKVESEARIDPPIHTEYFLSGGAMILIFIVGGASAVISFCIRSAIPGNMVEPPESTVLAYKSFLISTSHFMIELYVVSWIPADSIPMNDGWKRVSGHLKRSFPTVMTCPSGSS